MVMSVCATNTACPHAPHSRTFRITHRILSQSALTWQAAVSEFATIEFEMCLNEKENAQPENPRSRNGGKGNNARVSHCVYGVCVWVCVCMCMGVCVWACVCMGMCVYVYGCD